MNGSEHITDPVTVALVDLLSGVQRDVRHLLSVLHVAGTEGPLEEHVEAFERFGHSLSRFLEDISKAQAGDRVDLVDNVDLLQLRFHLREEIRYLEEHGPRDAARMRRSVALLHRHLPSLTRQLIDGAPVLDPLDHRLMTGLRGFTDLVYRDRFERFYANRSDRPYLNKFYRDYRPNGVPDTLLQQLDRLASDDPYDLYICLLTGGLTYAVLLELLGIPGANIRHVVCGRSSGSQFDRRIRFEPVDFDLAELTGRRVAIVEHNVATGATLSTALEHIAGSRPASVALIVDYLLPEVAGLTGANLAGRLRVELSEIHVLRPPAHGVRARDQNGVSPATPDRGVDEIKLGLARSLESRLTVGGIIDD